MKNRKIENIVKEWKNGNFELGLTDHEARWCRRYLDSMEKGFDEIVIESGECVFESYVPEMLEAAKKLGIEYFMFASGYSSAFEVVNAFVENGARVGKFVVKTYEDKTLAAFGEVKTVKVCGLRINL